VQNLGSQPGSGRRGTVITRRRRSRAIACLLALGLMVGACSNSSGDEDEDTDVAGDLIPAAPDLQGSTKRFPESRRVTEPQTDWFSSGCNLPFAYLQRVRRGVYGDGRGPDILVVPQIPHFFGAFTTTSHSGPWPYVQRVPLVFYGPGFVTPQGDLEVQGETTLADLAPTLSELFGIPFPKSHHGRAIPGVWLPEALRNGTPKMVLEVVWDGGGWNVLDTWPNAWPHLESLMEGGTSVQGVTVGSSPSVTPASHSNMGTGTFPKQHGIINIPMRNENGEVGQSFPQGSSKNLEVPTTADIFDQSTDNRAKVGMMAYRFFHLGMLGHGAYQPGGDRDYAIIANTRPGHLVTNYDYFKLPGYLQGVGGFRKDIRVTDAEDGKIDNEWRGHSLDLKQTRRHSPVWVRYQTRVLRTLFTREKFGRDDVTDFFLTNYKQIDDVGHVWNMLDPAMESVIESSDVALQDLTDYLNENVGENEWVLVLTADHGQAPDAQAIGAWPIQMTELTEDIARHFGMAKDEMFQSQQAAGFYLRKDAIEAEGITMEQVSNFVLNYRIKNNIKKGQDPPDQYDDRGDDPLFAAAFPASKMGKIWRCAAEKNDD
jgi:hypothetical protein